jgi:hypothetical protein
VTITYRGILPDLFREGQGIVALGKLNADGVVVADEVLAKHDEKYMPPEVTKALKDSGQAAAGGERRSHDAALLIPELGQLAMILPVLCRWCRPVCRCSAPGAATAVDGLARPAAWGQFAFLRSPSAA